MTGSPAPQARVAGTTLSAEVETIGRVQSVGDGIAQISGLPHARLEEVLRFETGQFGFAQTLDRDVIGCVLLDPIEGVAAGSVVRGTGDVVRVPVGRALLGRVVDPLGRPLDGGPPIVAERHAPIEQPAPAIVDRALVTEPVQTGILVIDSLFPLGRGQRAVDHRRPRHRQDRDCRGYHHQPEILRHRLHLCRGGAEIRHRRARDRRGPPARCARALHLRHRRPPPPCLDCNGLRRSPR